jgi:uncharacterized protein
MDVEWDARKARLDVHKHGIEFADAVFVLEDDSTLTTTEHAAGGEDRWITLGIDPLGRILVVVYTWRKNRIRSFQPARRHRANGNDTHWVYEERIRLR